MLAGGIALLVRTFRSLRSRQFDGAVLILVWLLLGAMQGCMIDGNVNRLNFLHFPLILCAVIGLDWMCRVLHGRWRWLGASVAAVYAVSFTLFIGYYFTSFQEKIDGWYDRGLDSALAYAQSCTDGDIRISDRISYPKILFYGQIEPQTFRETVVWRGEPGAFMSVESVDRYQFGSGEVGSDVSVLVADELGDELPEGTEVKVFDRIAVVCPADPAKN